MEVWTSPLYYLRALHRLEIFVPRFQKKKQKIKILNFCFILTSLLFVWLCLQSTLVTEITVTAFVNAVLLFQAEFSAYVRLATSSSEVVLCHSFRLFFHRHTQPARLAERPRFRRAVFPTGIRFAFIASQGFAC